MVNSTDLAQKAADKIAHVKWYAGGNNTNFNILSESIVLGM